MGKDKLLIGSILIYLILMIVGISINIPLVVIVASVLMIPFIIYLIYESDVLRLRALTIVIENLPIGIFKNSDNSENKNQNSDISNNIKNNTDKEIIKKTVPIINKIENNIVIEFEPVKSEDVEKTDNEKIHNEILESNEENIVHIKEIVNNIEDMHQEINKESDNVESTEEENNAESRIEETSTENITAEEFGQEPIVYWTPNGKSYHKLKKCITLSRSKIIHNGTIEESGKLSCCDQCNS